MDSAICHIDAVLNSMQSWANKFYNMNDKASYKYSPFLKTKQEALS